MPPGIDFSDDPLLQGRLFSYQDTQLSRLGTAELPPAADQPAEGLPVPRTSSATARCRRRSSRAAPTTSPTAWPRRARRAVRARCPVPASQLRPTPSATIEGEKVRVRSETVRRPLQPGAAVLPLADARSSRRTWSGARVRAVEGGARARAHARAGATCATSTRRWPSGSPTGLAMALPVGRKAAPVARHGRRRRRCASIDKYPGDAARAARSASSSPTAPTARSWPRCARRARARAAAVKIDRAQDRRRDAQGRQAAAGRRPAGRHAVGRCSTRWRWCCRRPAARRCCKDSAAVRLRAGRLRPPQGHRPSAPRPRPLLERAGVEPTTPRSYRPSAAPGRSQRRRRRGCGVERRRSGRRCERDPAPGPADGTLRLGRAPTASASRADPSAGAAPPTCWSWAPASAAPWWRTR